jgi:hypothetical protein
MLGGHVCVLRLSCWHVVYSFVRLWWFIISPSKWFLTAVAIRQNSFQDPHILRTLIPSLMPGCTSRDFHMAGTFIRFKNCNYIKVLFLRAGHSIWQIHQDGDIITNRITSSSCRLVLDWSCWTSVLLLSFCSMLMIACSLVPLTFNVLVDCADSSGMGSCVPICSILMNASNSDFYRISWIL